MSSALNGSAVLPRFASVGSSPSLPTRYALSATPSCRVFDRHTAPSATSRARCNAGSNNPTSSATTLITTSSSTSVNPEKQQESLCFMLWLPVSERWIEPQCQRAAGPCKEASGKESR